MWVSSPLEPGHIHLWQADLDGPLAAGRETPDNGLSAEELRRASQLRGGAPRRRFIAARRILRGILSGYLDCAPSEVEIAYGPFGKPRLARPEGWGIDFNLAHADGCALFAVARDRAVGVDIERIQEVPEWPEIGRLCLPEEEFERLLKAPPEERTLAFIRSWTRAEAVLKARGEGWVGPAARRGPPFDAGFTLCEVAAPAGYLAALALAPCPDEAPLTISPTASYPTASHFCLPATAKRPYY